MREIYPLLDRNIWGIQEYQQFFNQNLNLCQIEMKSKKSLEGKTKLANLGYWKDNTTFRKCIQVSLTIKISVCLKISPQFSTSNNRGNSSWGCWAHLSPGQWKGATCCNFVKVLSTPCEISLRKFADQLCSIAIELFLPILAPSSEFCQHS